MKTPTKRNEKFNKARAFVMNNPDLARAIANWQKMKGERLYDYLTLHGVEWSTLAKSWSWAQARGTTPAQNGGKPTPQTSNEAGIVLVRIMAHSTEVAQATSALLELSEAVGYVVIDTSPPIPNRNSNWSRVYVKLARNKSR